MTTDDSDPFKGRTYGDLVFLTIHDRLFYIGRLSPSQREKWRRDHPERWKTREDALRDLQARAAIEAKPTETSSTASGTEVRTAVKPEAHLPAAADKQLPDNAPTNTPAPTIENAKATVPADDEIIIGGRQFVSEARVAEILGRHPRTLQRWHKKGKGPPRTTIGRKVYYELNDLPEWIDRGKIR